MGRGNVEIVTENSKKKRGENVERKVIQFWNDFPRLRSNK